MCDKFEIHILENLAYLKNLHISILEFGESYLADVHT